MNKDTKTTTTVKDMQPEILSKLDAILTKMNLRKEWDMLNEENRRLTGENERLKSAMTEAKMAEKKKLQSRLNEAETVLHAIADMRSRLHARLWPRDWWVGLECISRAEKYLGRDNSGKKIA